MSTHKLTTAIEINHGGEPAHPVFEIVFEYSAGRPARLSGPPEHCYPGDPAELWLLSAKVIEADGLDMSDAEVIAYAEDWLDGEGFDIAVQSASEDLLCAFEDAMEQRRDDLMERHPE